MPVVLSILFFDLDFSILFKNTGLTKTDLFRLRLFKEIPSKSDDNIKITADDIDKLEVREVPIEVEEIQREFEKFDALIPVCNFAWEGDQTAANDVGSSTTLAKEIATDLDLVGQPQSLDLFTQEGYRATYNITDKNNNFKPIYSS